MPLAGRNPPGALWRSTARPEVVERMIQSLGGRLESMYEAVRQKVEYRAPGT